MKKKVQNRHYHFAITTLLHYKVLTLMILLMILLDFKHFKIVINSKPTHFNEIRL